MRPLLYLTILLTLGLMPARAQFKSTVAPFDPGIIKIFGPRQVYSATLTSETKAEDSLGKVSMPGKVSFDQDKSMIEYDLAAATGDRISPQRAQQLKTLGMDVSLQIFRLDLKQSYTIYPSAHAYLVTAINPSTNLDALKLEMTQLGKETVEGHVCVKNKAVVTNKEGKHQEYTVWTAPDLKDFPIKIAKQLGSMSAVLTFHNISFDKPAASLFEVPKDCIKYDGEQAMRTAITKKLSQGQHP